MRMAHENEVDARNLFRDRDRAIFVWYLTRVGLASAQVLLVAHVHCDHYYVGTLFSSQHWNPFLRFSKRFTKLQARIVWSVLPIWDSRSRKSQHADTYPRD